MDVEKERCQASAPRQGARPANGNWPARTQRLIGICCDLSLAKLREPLLRCLHEFEQQLFALAERGRLPSEQQDFIASRQLVQQHRSEFEQQFMAQLVEAFSSLGEVPPAAPAGPPAASPSASPSVPPASAPESHGWDAPAPAPGPHGWDAPAPAPVADSPARPEKSEAPGTGTGFVPPT